MSASVHAIRKKKYPLNLQGARKVLGPIRVFYSRQKKAWLLDQRPSTLKIIIAAAEARVLQLEPAA